MGIPVMVLGASGSGKSTSLRNFKENEIGIFNVASKPLPFRGNLKKVDHATYSIITKVLKDNKLTLEGMFSVVLLCGTDGKEHWFETQSDGVHPAKTPLGMFDSNRIDNDLKMVDTTIREYWNLKGEK